ncbi:hypothetical protein [Candidatus Villigracilis saccharophilus]|uniref:hypothetical protein n=1 Tax=Candidatus Villigracilis saccharophilus TaxID=3140684 RepID=UPI003137561F|nr:hypothetical protein [Anaerolineales bacterium]
MLPSLNQIGFDYIEWIVAPVLITPSDAKDQGKFVLWAIGAKRTEDGSLVPDPQSDFTLPLNGRYQGADFIAIDQKFPMPITGINIPFNLFELRGTFNADGTTTRPAAFASTDTLSIPTFGPYLVIAGLANNWYKDMLVAGTYVTRMYDGAANSAPAGIQVSDIAFSQPSRSLRVRSPPALPSTRVFHIWQLNIAPVWCWWILRRTKRSTWTTRPIYQQQKMNPGTCAP